MARTKITPIQLSNEWYEEIGRTTLSTTNSTGISVASLPARKYLMIIINVIVSSSSPGLNLTFNNDSGTNYAYRINTNGTSANGVSQTNLFLDGASATDTHAEVWVNNTAAQEKLVNSLSMSKGTAGAGNAPSQRIGAGKWANTSAQINRVDVLTGGSGVYAAGSEVIVLGHD